MKVQFESEVLSVLQEVETAWSDYFKVLENDGAYSVESALKIGVVNFLRDNLTKDDDWAHAYHFYTDEIIKVFHLFHTLDREIDYLNILSEIAVLRSLNLKQFPSEVIGSYRKNSIALAYFLLRMIESSNGKNTAEALEMFQDYIAKEVKNRTNEGYEKFIKGQYTELGVGNLLNELQNREKK